MINVCGRFKGVPPIFDFDDPPGPRHKKVGGNRLGLSKKGGLRNPTRFKVLQPILRGKYKSPNRQPGFSRDRRHALKALLWTSISQAHGPEKERTVLTPDSCAGRCQSPRRRRRRKKAMACGSPTASPRRSCRIWRFRRSGSMPQIRGRQGDGGKTWGSVDQNRGRGPLEVGSEGGDVPPILRSPQSSSASTRGQNDLIGA